MARNVSMQFGRSGGIVQNRPGWKFIRGGEILDGTSEVFSFAPGGMYILAVESWNASTFARNGRQLNFICSPEEDIFGTVAVTRDSIVSGGTARYTYSANNDSTLTLSASSSAYGVRYALYRIDGAGGNSGQESDIPAYTGQYTVTPTEAVQTLNTANKRMTADVEVDEIPTDYGQVEQSGTDLSIS